MVPPTATCAGLPLLVTARSQEMPTVVFTLAVLLSVLGSLVDDVTEAVSATVPAGILEATFTPIMISADAPDARVAIVQLTLPVAPTAGVVQVQPAGVDTEAKVVLPGIASVKLTEEAEAGPLFVTVCV